MEFELFNEGELLEDVCRELGQEFVRKNLDQVRKEIHSSHVLIISRGLELYQSFYVKLADINAFTRGTIRKMDEDWLGWIISFLPGCNMDGRLQRWTDEDRISHAIFKAISRKLDVSER